MINGTHRPPPYARRMRISYDASVDAAYIYLTSENLRVGRDSVSCETPEGAGGVVMLDWQDGKIVGLEVLDASKHLHRDLLARPSDSGMSEGAGFVNTALLEEEHDQG